MSNTFTVPDITTLPDAELTAAGHPAQTQPTTSDNVMHLLSCLGISVRFNMMTGLAVLQHPAFDESMQGQAIARMVFHDMVTRLRMKSRATVDDMLSVIARENAYHPMQEYMEGLTWDETDRVGALIDTVKTDNPLWSVYLENWLVQVVAGVCGWRDVDNASLPYVLTLVGAQGTGKSQWLANLGSPWIASEAELHLSSASGKDHQLEVLKHPMAELAELDGIFRKSDVSHMKSFISRTQDSIRAPYARSATIRPRMTTFCASVNDAEFLNDPSGSRRFWPIEVLDIVWDFEMDWDQLWAQAHGMWVADQDFTLTAAEDAERALLALTRHTLISAEEEDLREFYRCHNGHTKYPSIPLNRSEILRMLYGNNRKFDPKTISGVGRVLEDLCGKHRTLEAKQRAWEFPFNDLAQDRRTWPDKCHIDLV